jgi:hypothetical protein
LLVGVLKVKGPSGLDFPLQTAFWQNNITCGIQQQQLVVWLELLVVVQELIQLHNQQQVYKKEVDGKCGNNS